MYIAYFVFCVLLVNSAQGETYQYHSIGSFTTNLPSFLNIGYFSPTEKQNANATLILSAFDPSSGEISLVTDIGSQLSNFSLIHPTLVTNELQWPNEVLAVPYEIFNEPVLGVGNGFLVPGNRDGYVSIISSDGKPHKISAKKSNWFYHVTEWWDMDGDGLDDCVTARAYVPLVPLAKSKGELLWLKNPGIDSAFSEQWEEHVLTSGPDVLFHFVWIDGEEGNSQPQIIATEFFTAKLTIYWIEEGLWATADIQSRVIDDNLGSPFDSQYIDLNNDGKKDLLVTNHQAEASNSAVFSYTVPANWKTESWERHVLATNITTLVPGQGQASPGIAIAFHPNIEDTSSKRNIIVAGDGSEYAFMLYPNSEDPNDWTYNREDIIFTGCTVGQIAVGDVNNDSFVEFFIPAYENNTVYGYTYGKLQ